MKKLIIFTISLVLFFVFVSPAILAFGIRLIPGGDQSGYYGKREIYGSFTISQEFISQDNYLSAIGTSIGNPNLKNQKEIVLTLFDSTGKVIRSSSLNGFNVGDGAFVKFVFDPIQDSKNKKYSFTIASPDAGPGDSIYMFVSTSSTSWIGKAEYGKEEIQSGLPIVVYYKPVSRLKLVGDIYSSWIRRLFSRSQLPGY